MTSSASMLLSQVPKESLLIMKDMPVSVHRCMPRCYKFGAPLLSGSSPKEPTPTLRTDTGFQHFTLLL